MNNTNSQNKNTAKSNSIIKSKKKSLVEFVKSSANVENEKLGCKQTTNPSENTKNADSHEILYLENIKLKNLILTLSAKIIRSGYQTKGSNFPKTKEDSFISDADFYKERNLNIENCKQKMAKYYNVDEKHVKFSKCENNNFLQSLWTNIMINGEKYLYMGFLVTKFLRVMVN